MGTPGVNDPGARPDGVAPVDRRVLAVAAAVLAVLMALSGRYGFHRDELYFLDCARHLQAGYVDQGLVGPLLARVSLALFGVSLPGLRLWPALACAATVVVGGLTAREFGAARRGQLLAALATATMPVLLAPGHIANTTAYDTLAWAALALVVARVGRTGDCRWWLAAGAVLGVGWDNNHLVGWFAVALTAGTLLSGGRRFVLNRWFAAGVVVAAALVAPDLWWQATHGWPMRAMTTALNARNGGADKIPIWILGQPLMAGVAAVWIWIAGLRFLWRSRVPLWRALVWAYALSFLVFALTTGGQVYYLAGEYPCLLAAGAVAVDRWLHGRRRRVAVLSVAMAGTTALVLPGILPVLAPSSVAGHPDREVLAETIGWPDLVRTVDGVWRSLPPDRRAKAVIFTSNYSEASAINELGRGSGLPTAVSGQNSEWWWGPGNPDATTVVALVRSPRAEARYADVLRRFFTSVQEVAVVTNPYGVHNFEWDSRVYVCTGPREPWGRIWPHLRHYD